ncbi:hypothetical protein [Sphingopyxis sp. R3-92]|uniref:hypothetical protein n=1 Tax=Sphingopyxis sp. R3-92 TaxID=3158553 RepID=UPI003EE4D2E3
MIVYFFALLASAASPDTTAAAPSPDAPETAPKEKLICTNRPVLGSRLATERVCQTESQRKAESDMRRAQDSRRSTR